MCEKVNEYYIDETTNKIQSHLARAFTGCDISFIFKKPNSERRELDG